MEDNERLLISIEAAPASDSWGFVGVVAVGEYEAYRTIRSYPAPPDALKAAQHLLADVLGALMAGQEWRTTTEEFGHAARLTELGYGLGARKQSDEASEPTSTSIEGPGA